MEKFFVPMDYTGYQFRDFLQDDFFISSIKNPTGESVDFWNKLLEDKKINRDEYLAAKQFIETIQMRYGCLVSNEELSSLWNDIDDSNRKERSPLRRFLYFGSCTAACLVVAVLSVLYFNKNGKNTDSDLVSFARNNKAADRLSNIQVILSDQKTVQLTEQEPCISYDSTVIKIAQSDISKKEAAEYNQLIVPVGKRSKLTLSDGTVMYVNSGSRLVYPVEFSTEKREIYVDGEIFIRVTHDVKRPFTVKTGNIDIQVLGTSFNVMAYETDHYKQVVLVNGSVKIRRKGRDEAILRPAQMYEVDNENSTSTLEDVDVAKYTSWVNGLYLFESESLEVVLTRLSRYYGTDVICDQEIAHLKCSGKMDLKDDLKDILQGLSFSFPVQIKYEYEKYNVTKSM